MTKKITDKKVIKGRWYNINKKIKKKIIAKYHRIKDWKMDPKGYFLIAIDRKNFFIRVGYCKFSKQGNPPIHDMVAEIKGKTAIESKIPTKGIIQSIDNSEPSKCGALLSEAKR